MHGRDGDRRIRSWHMWPVLEPTTSSVAASDSAAAITPDSFSKDGRKICVGDCALFKPPKDSPPFIGIIRRLLLEKEENLGLSVNWLYRPADVKLGKGTLLEAAPNEVFYSFHKDEIPAASLLHPCKVAFLRKGVELPSGISSFVCRRVYDIESKCLWWLTDQDYINERQEEVDHLLDKTQLAMYGAVQSDGRSPKRMNGSAGTPQSRPGSESAQNSGSSLPSQFKGRKRDRVDQGFDQVKRERVSRSDEIDSGPEHMLKSEIAKITDKGGLVNFEGVEKLVQLMQPDSTENKIDLTCRIMLVDVIAVTDSFDCLGWFVQLKGLPVLDEWLQEVHKGKIGDGSSPKENDKSVEDFLFVLLRALDKLPVNLHALQTCNVGKSVNHLRSHKNSEIQKKARTLVDTWKKRVEAEMNIIDAKSGSSRGGSWPSKSLLSEVSPMGNRRNGGSTEVSVKSSNILSSACKTPSVKLGSGEAVAKIVCASPGLTKSEASVSLSGAASVNDPSSATLVHGGFSDMPLSTIKEEKSSSSSQSQNNSQSCSSDQAKTGGSSCREDARSSAGSVSVSKISGSASRHRKLSNGVQGSALSGVQKETSLGKFSTFRKNFASERVSPTRGTFTCERAPDTPSVDRASGQRLIVRLLNTGRSPVRSSNGDSFEDATTTLSKAFPSAQCEKLEHQDRKITGKSDALQPSSATNSNLDLCKGTDRLARSDEGNASFSNILCNEWSRTGDGVKLMESSKCTGSSSGVIPKLGKSYDASFSSMNALVESCIKFSEASATASGGDDIGMNLLASVAAGEMSRSDVSPLGSPGRNSPLQEESCSANDVKSRHLDEDTVQSEVLGNNDRANGRDTLEPGNSVDSLRDKNESPGDAMPMSMNISGDGKVALFGSDEKTGECCGQLNSAVVDWQQNAHSSYLKCDGKPSLVNDASAAVSSEDAAKEKSNVESKGADQFHDRKKLGAVQTIINSVLASKHNLRNPLSEEVKKVNYADENITENRVLVVPEAAASAKVEKEGNEKSPFYSSSEMFMEDKITLLKKSGCSMLTEKTVPITAKVQEEFIGGKSDVVAPPSGSVNVLGMESKPEKSTDMKAVSETEQSEKPNIDLCSTILDQNVKCCEDDKPGGKGVVGHFTDESSSPEEPPQIPVQHTVEHMKSRAGDTGECTYRVNASSVSVAGLDTVVKLDFDLNEGFPVDDGCKGELVKSSVPGNLSTVHLPCPLPFPISSMSVNFPASITVASAAKGPFFHPENPSRNKGELGWKGSAATSAFRPAEPRKTLDMPLRTSGYPSVNNISSKQGRTPLDIDLNVPDQRGLEDTASQNSAGATCLEFGPLAHRGIGLDFDLNRVDDSSDIGLFSVSNSCKLEIPQPSSRSSLACGFSTADLNTSRDFDLNNGPGPDEGGVTETAPRGKGNNISFLSPFHGVRMNSMDQGNFSSLFPMNNSYSAIAIPSVLPGRGDQSYSIVPAIGSQRILGPPTGSFPFGPEFYRGTVLSSSPAVPYAPAAPFQYPGFPFETNFSVSSNSYPGSSTAYVDSSSGGQLCLPAIPSSQLVGPTGVVSSHYPRPFIMNLPGGTNNVSTESRKWGGQALDLNTGPGNTDIERRDERFSSTLRQLPIPSSQAPPVDEQIRMLQMGGGLLKRKEPDGGGWDGGDRISYKQQPSWQ
ncbi:non-specific serine,threonine protein kinase [Sarracenia purpurea var. burkii]